MKMKYKFDDSVLYRLVQVLQESMLLGVDVTDIMRKIEVTPSQDNETVLVLTEEYVESVKQWHSSLVANAEQLQQTQQKIIVSNE